VTVSKGALSKNYWGKKIRKKKLKKQNEKKKLVFFLLKQ